VLEMIDENLPDDVDPREWNWDALAKTANMRWDIHVRDRDLKRAGRDDVAELLIEKGRAAVMSNELADGARFLDPEFGLLTARGWVLHKFGFELPLDEIRGLEPSAFKDLVRTKAEAAYRDKEIEYPVMAALYHFTARDSGGHKRYDREKLVPWAKERFQADLSLDDLKNKQREEIRALLVDHSRRFAEEADKAAAEAEVQLDTALPDTTAVDDGTGRSYDSGRLAALSSWLHKEYGKELLADEMAQLSPVQLRREVDATVRERYRIEMSKMERALVLELLDTAWKDHLLAMDHLRSSVGLRGYAQVDPKVEYKREGMKTFERMWTSLGERVTDLIFRMEQLDERFVGSTWANSQAVHEEAASAGEIAEQQQAAIDGTQADRKPEPFRKREQRVGRNAPCPCGSGKKFKNCCMHK